jgi:microcystin-dependent protein
MEPFIGEIRLFGFGKPPQGWAPCEGQTLAISTNQALFAILGTRFGGDGIRTFMLPDLRGRAPVAASQSLPAGSRGGEDKHTLTVTEMPAHTHPVMASNATADKYPIANNVWATNMNYADNANLALSGTAVGSAGGGAAHNNMQPYLGSYYCVALQGIFPPRQ